MLMSITDGPPALSLLANAALSQLLRHVPNRTIVMEAGGSKVLHTRMDTSVYSNDAVAEALLSMSFLADVDDFKDEIGALTLPLLSRLIRISG